MGQTPWLAVTCAACSPVDRPCMPSLDMCDQFQTLHTGSNQAFWRDWVACLLATGGYLLVGGQVDKRMTRNRLPCVHHLTCTYLRSERLESDAGNISELAFVRYMHGCD